jgi:serine/threonine protein kinase
MMELRHPGVVKVLEARVEEGGLAYFVMEYLSGGDLQRRVIEKTLPAMLKLKTVERIGEALQHAHKRGLIHRDVKPANILLTGDGTPKLTDFDLVHANDTTGGTRTGALGTWIYASPEAQHDASQVTAAADVFSLGMVAVFLLSGRSLSPDAFRDPSNYIDQLNCSPALRSVLKKATEWNQRRRYPTMELFLASFRAARAEHRRFLDSDGSPDIAAEFEHDSEWKRNRSVVALVFGFILSGLALIGYCSSKDLRGDEHAAQAMAVTGNATPEEETPAAAGRTATAQPDDVIVWSSPPHVEVYQNGSLVGNTPYTLNRPRSTIVKLELRLPGYEPRTVTVSEDYSSSSHFVLEKLNDKIEKPKTVPPSVDRPKPAVRNRDRSPGGIRSGSSGYTGRKPVPK